jgi:hypothetical protein
MINSNNIEHFIVRSRGSGGGIRYNTRKSTPTNRRRSKYSSTSYTLGRTGGAPFWGWSYYPWMTVSYPFYDYAEYPEFVEYAPVEEVKKDKEIKEDKTVKGSKDINKKI